MVNDHVLDVTLYQFLTDNIIWSLISCQLMNMRMFSFIELLDMLPCLSNWVNVYIICQLAYMSCLPWRYYVHVCIMGHMLYDMLPIVQFISLGISANLNAHPHLCGGITHHIYQGIRISRLNTSNKTCVHLNINTPY